MLMNVVEQLKEQEGTELSPYYCSADKLSVGHGRNLEAVGYSNEEMAMFARPMAELYPLSEDEAEALLVNDVNRILSVVSSWVIWSKLNEARQGVIINMCFNLGIQGFLRFEKTIAYIKAGSYEAASREMLDSKWAREDVSPERSGALSDQMFSGMWQ